MVGTVVFETTSTRPPAACFTIKLRPPKKGHCGLFHPLFPARPAGLRRYRERSRSIHDAEKLGYPTSFDLALAGPQPAVLPSHSEYHRIELRATGHRFIGIASRRVWRPLSQAHVQG